MLPHDPKPGHGERPAERIVAEALRHIHIAIFPTAHISQIFVLPGRVDFVREN
jgi:hypothetical protein